MIFEKDAQHHWTSRIVAHDLIRGQLADEVVLYMLAFFPESNASPKFNMTNVRVGPLELFHEYFPTTSNNVGSYYILLRVLLSTLRNAKVLKLK